MYRNEVTTPRGDPNKLTVRRHRPMEWGELVAKRKVNMKQVYSIKRYRHLLRRNYKNERGILNGLRIILE